MPSNVCFIGYATSKSGKTVTLWEVQCLKCKRKRTVKRADHAKSHASKVCKFCSNKNNHPQGEYRGIRISFIEKYRLQGLARGKLWNLSHDDVANQADKQNRKCALSGIDLCFVGDFKDITASLDRINNEIGYEVGNIQWVHKDINMMRGQLSIEKFLSLCKSISEYKGDKMANRDKEMIDGVATLIRKVKSKANRKQIAQYALRDFKKERVKVDPDKFMRRVGL